MDTKYLDKVIKLSTVTQAFHPVICRTYDDARISEIDSI